MDEGEAEEKVVVMVGEGRRPGWVCVLNEGVTFVSRTESWRGDR